MSWIAVRRSLLVGLTLLIGVWFFVRHGADSEIFYADSLGYYSYLPSLLHGDAGHAHENAEAKGLPRAVAGYFQTLSQLQPTPTGEYIVQYTMGVAFAHAPFFAAAHGYALATHTQASGYSQPYAVAFRLASLFYALLGAWLVFRMLRRWFNTDDALLVACLLLVGTNLLWFALRQPGMAHPVSFCLVVALMELSIRVHERPTTWGLAGLGLLLGWLTLIRPTDAVFGLLPLLYGLTDRESFRRKAALIKDHPLGLLVALVCFFLPLLPQLAFWKAHTGQWFYYSYNEQGFFWDRPRIYKGLFSFQNGWFAYTPLMALAVLGWLRVRAWSAWALAWLILLPLYVYITYAWWCWWYMNGLGSRPMIHVYALMAFPLAALLAWAGSGSRWRKGGMGLLVLILVGINLRFHQLDASDRQMSEMGHPRFAFQTFLQPSLRYRDLVLWDTRVIQPKAGRLDQIATLACEDFEAGASDSAWVSGELPADRIRHNEANEAGTAGWDSGWAGSFAFRLPAKQEFMPPPIVWTVDEAASQQTGWFRCRAHFRTNGVNADLYQQHLFTFEIRREGRESALAWKGMRINNKLGFRDFVADGGQASLRRFETGRWDELDFYIPIPDDLQTGDVIRLGVWNMGYQELWVDDVCLEWWQDAE